MSSTSDSNMPRGRKITRRKFVALIGVIVGSVSVASCGSQAVTPTTTPSAQITAPAPSASQVPPAAGKRGGKLVYAHRADIFSFDPSQLPIGNWPMYHTVYDPVVRLDQKLQPHPALAESWDSDSSGKQLTLKLRKGVLFHSGREFNADDIVFNIARYQDPATAANMRPQVSLIKDVKVRDPYTVVLEFEAPNPLIFDTLDLLFIIDKDGVVQIKNKGAGTGPFKFAEWSPGDKARFVRNENYWNKTEPYLDEVIIQAFPDQQSMATALQAGTVHVAETPTAQDFLRLKDNRNLQSINSRSAIVVNVNFNVENPNLANKYVRQAINHAIDRTRFSEIAYQGLTKPTCQPAPNGSWAFFPDLEDACKFDLGLAKSLLEKGGAAGGFEIEALVSTAASPESPVLAQIMRDDLEKIGIKLKITDLEPTAYRAMGDGAKFPGLYIQAYGRSTKDPGSVFGTTVPFRPQTNVARFRSDEYERLIADGASTLDQDKRKEIYRKLNQILLDEAFALSIAPRIDLFLFSAKLKNLELSTDGMPYLGRVWFE